MSVRNIASRVAPVLLAVALGACASTGLSDTQKSDLYREHAGEPVSSFHFFGRLNGWTPLGEDALAVWTKPSEAWLLDLTGRCPDLAFARAISLTSNQNRVHARFDKVIPLGSNPHRMPCHIAQIRPLDARALRSAERELREGDVVPAQSADGAGT